MNDNYIILYGDPKNEKDKGYAYVLKKSKYYKFIQYNNFDNEKHEIILNNRDVKKVIEFLIKTMKED